MHLSISQLRAQVRECNRAAQHLLAEKGAQRWSVLDQIMFDSTLDTADRASAEIEGRLSAANVTLSKYMQQREGFEIFLRKGPKERNDTEKATLRNAMSTTTGSEGGHTLAPMVAGDLVDTLKGYGWMRQVAEQMTTDSGADMGVPASDGSSETGELLGQNAAASLLDPSFATRAVPTYKFSSKVFTIPVELLRDSGIDIVAFFMQRARDRIGRIQNTKFTLGTGTGEPTGLVTAAGIGKTGTTGQTLTVVYDDLVDLVDSVDEASLGMPDKQPGMPPVGAGWMMSQSTRKVVRKLKDTNGRPIWTPGSDDGAATAGSAQLLDHPVFINNDMPSPAANAKSIAFGNLRRYLVRDVREVTLLRFDDSAFALKGQVGFLAYARAGGNLLDTTAVKLYAHSAT